MTPTAITSMLLLLYKNSDFKVNKNAPKNSVVRLPGRLWQSL